MTVTAARAVGTSSEPGDAEKEVYRELEENESFACL